MQFWSAYSLFLLKAVSLAAVIASAFIATAKGLRTPRRTARAQLDVISLNDRMRELADAIRKPRLTRRAWKKLLAARRKRAHRPHDRRRLFVLNFQGDIRASAVESLRQEITLLLLSAEPSDRILVRLESGGGLVHSYGLATAQLLRLRNRGLHLTVSVDKVAASGGYMMACVADRIIAAPFAILGSIGVLAQIPNFNRLLKRHDIDFEQLSAGKYKRTLSLFGETTEEGREKMREELEDTHALFKDLVQTHRPQLDIAAVATGEHWYGKRALEHQLVDELQTSDEFLQEAWATDDIYELHYRIQQSWRERLLGNRTATSLLTRFLTRDHKDLN